MADKMTENRRHAMGKVEVEALRTPPSVPCLFPNQCGVGVDCSACLSQELARRSDSIKQLLEHIDTLTTELESLKRQVTRWVPVSERLPPLKRQFLGSDGKKSMLFVAPQNADELGQMLRVYNIVEWQEMPKPSLPPEPQGVGDGR